jgi:chitodextrinase
MKKIGLYRRAGVILLITWILFWQTAFKVDASIAPDTQPPSVPSGLAAINITCTSITLSWSLSSDNVGVKGYQVYRDGKKIITTTKCSYTNSELIPGRKYTYTVRAYDACGNVSGDSAALIVSAKSDNQNPSVPSGLAVFSVSYNSVSVTWSPSTDNTSIKGYEVYCGDKKVSATSATYYECKGLTPGKSYSFFVKALDIAGNYSMQSNSIYASTVSDNTPPSVPDSLKATFVTGTEVILAWSPSSDNVKVKGYDIFLDGAKVATTSKTTYISDGLTPGKTYTYTVRSIDSIGNISSESGPLKASTSKDLEVPTAPLFLKANLTSRSSISLTWKASTDNIKVKGYKIYCNGFNIATTTRTNCTVKKSSGLGIDVYWVKAYDLVDNLSRSSNCVTLFTF